MNSKQKQQQVWEELIRRNHNNNNNVVPNNNCHPPEIATTTPRHWPSYDEVLQHLSTADYTNILTCPYDILPEVVLEEQEHPLGSTTTKTTNKSITGGHPTITCPQQQQQQQQPSTQKHKILCPHGVVGCADMTIFAHVPYTGLLNTTTTTTTTTTSSTTTSSLDTTLPCIIRLSSAMLPPSEGITSTWGKTMLYTFMNTKIRNSQIFPCAAMKVFRNPPHIPSGNLLFGGSKLGQRENDFFAHCVCTSMTEQMPRYIQPFVRKFWTYSNHPLSLGVSDFCKINMDGTIVEDNDIAFPFAIILKPCVQDHVENTSSSSSKPDQGNTGSSFDNFLDRTMTLPIGTQLYDIYACPDPLDVPDASKLQRIGYITLTSPMILSSSNDGLIFRHQRKEDDYHLRPHWPPVLQHRVSMSSGRTNGTIGQLAGWKLFEEQISKGTYVDFEKHKT